MLHLDHIIILVPHTTLLSPPSWITDNFTLSPGGRHADGKTENKLICFRDGSYVELISFVDDSPENQAGHWWGTKKFGIIDFAFTDDSGDADVQFSQLKQRLTEKEVEYDEPVAGGRKRPDGVDVKWKVTFPVLSGGRQRGESPFFCHDTTPRNLRVPVEDKNIVHPSGAIGVKQMSIYLPEEKFPGIVDGYQAVLGTDNLETGEAALKLGAFSLGRLYGVDGVSDPRFRVEIPSEKGKTKAMEERSGLLIGDLVFACHGAGEQKGVGRIDPHDGYMGGIFLDFTKG